MKYIILLVFIFQSFIGFSQRSGGGRSSGGGRGQNQGPPKEVNKENRTLEETNIKDFAGLHYFDSKLVIKEIKIKDDKEKETFEALFIIYNQELKEIEKEHLLLIETTELETRIKEKKAIENNDIKAMFEAKRNASITLKPVINNVIEIKKVLNEELEKSLSEKSFKKWIKYFEQLNTNKPPLLNNEPDSDFQRRPSRR